ncbi:uncharacterized protein [Miscanthus floridulus]|uniref:uncharacterized protein n=1 Tax=Miscanthus floridulus TaxID=154761 RepID=UPI003457EE96
MVGLLKKASGGFTHLLIPVDKLPKWIEAKPITNICLEETVKFFLDIIYWFGVSNCIITDHGTNFTRKKFLDFYDEYGIRIDWASVEHPWFTPFFLAYGAKAVLPSNLDHGAPRVKAFDLDQATEAQQDVVDLLEETRETTVIRFALYQQILRRYHERKIRGRILEVGDLILRRTQSTKDKHKLSPPWEGPYTVTKMIQPGTYWLKDDNGNVLTNTWNIEQ